MSERVDLTPHIQYRIDPEVLDTFPVGTFLVQRHSLTYPEPSRAVRLVKPNTPEKYQHTHLTPDGRLLYYFWRHSGGSEAVKKLHQASISHTWSWIIQPGDKGFDEMDAFKIACDHRRGQIVSTGLLYRALGLDISSETPNL